MFGCKHDWELLKTERFEPVMTSMQFINLKNKQFLEREAEKLFLKRGVISVCKCKKCGVINHLKTVF